jgi:hypothetical protein
MLHPGIFDSHDELYDESAPLGSGKKLGKHGIIETIAVVGRVEADAGHVVVFMTAAEVLAPIGERGIDGAERAEQHRPGSTAIVDQPGVYTAYILVKHAVETPRPSLSHATVAELLDEPGKLVARKPAERPSR